MPIKEIRMLQKYDTESDFINDDLVLFMGEIAVSTDSTDTKQFKFKIGNGVDTWSDLPYHYCIDGPHYLFVPGDRTPAENAIDLKATYDLAKISTPDGNALSATNRIKVLVGPGKYDFRNDYLNINASYVDVVSLSGDCDVDIITSHSSGIVIDYNNVYIRGISVGTRKISINGDFPLLTLENCEGGDGSFNSTSKLSGTFINCIGGEKSFGYNCSIIGVFKNCIASHSSFGYLDAGSMGIDNALFENCVAGNYSFGYGSGLQINNVDNCVFTNCTAGTYSFAVGSKSVDSTWINCTGGDYCFGSNTTTSKGTYENCVAGIRSFGRSAEGTYRNCKASNDSFGKGGFGIKGNLYFCIMTGSDYDFSGGGKAYSSIDNSRFWAGTSTLPL